MAVGALYREEHLLSDSVSRYETNDLPEPVRPIAELMSSFPAPWALCGGWAVDAWLGRETREHADIDLSVFIEHQREVYEHLAGWQLIAHTSGDVHGRWDGQHLEYPNHVMARRDTGEPFPDRPDKAEEDGFSLDIQFGERDGDEWVLSGEPRISLPVRDCVEQSPWGLPTVVPEVLLFFKASELRRRDRLDFARVLPQLSEGQRGWLREALATVGHPWLADLS